MVVYTDPLAICADYVFSLGTANLDYEEKILPCRQFCILGPRPFFDHALFLGQISNFCYEGRMELG